MTGQEYERAFQEVGEGESKTKGGSKRHSAREKKPVTIDDLGYTGGSTKTAGKKNGVARCEQILAQLRKHPYASQFYTLAFPANGGEPMDLCTVEQKLKAGAYSTPYHFALDVRKIWNRSWAENAPGSEPHNFTTEISNYFEKLMRELSDTQSMPQENAQIEELRKKVSKVEGNLRKIESAPAAASKVGILDKPMSVQEKALLRQNIMKLPQEKLQGVIDIIRDSIDLDKNKEELEFDIDKLSTRTCRQLDQYVKKCIRPSPAGGKKKAPAKATKAPPRNRAPVPTPMLPEREEVPLV